MSCLETPLEELEYIVVLHAKGKVTGVVSQEGFPRMIAFPFRKISLAQKWIVTVEKDFGQKGLIFKRIRQEE